MDQTRNSNVVRLRPEPDRSALPGITSLSFVKDFLAREKGRKRRTNFRCFWAVSPSADYGADCIAGEHMALEFLRFCESCLKVRFSGWGILAWIAQDMPPKRTGLEIGFFSVVGYAATTGVRHGEALVKYREREREREPQL